ncbi:amidoligase family protein [Pseudooceanicola sp. CBS1P-1]|uniref:Amidoligase enzyme n=1 Tax=Pseudooceanicola albus TaxID=2692189 RepID=A0A6L7G118_9RHOB|nr:MULTISPECIES: amidoligase family protein [Pseudooceanicola]MBT9382649.1 amidoligase family protein [Pseudooceanicola endophyticus]MXN17188.1 hypothetical protein [Pseudooceanicola albus]
MTTHPDPLPALPTARDAEGKIRLLGVEVEFGGLTEGRAARILARETGGTLGRNGTDYRVSGTPFGDCKLYMDTAYRDERETAFARAALDFARNFVPVELVTAPFDPARLPQLDAVIRKFHAAGAVGTEQGLFLGFGVHLNIQTIADEPHHLWSVTTAFALLEPLLRRSWPIHINRRVLPFVDPYPASLRDALAARLLEMPFPDVDALEDIYLQHAPSRNHALDLLPALAHHDPALEGRAFGSSKGVSGRPAFHYRMPDSRLGDPDWSLVAEWALWTRIEALAEDREMLLRLCAAWGAMREHLTFGNSDWAGRCRDMLLAGGHAALARGWQGRA